jgi:hypothetical protein
MGYSAMYTKNPNNPNAHTIIIFFISDVVYEMTRILAARTDYLGNCAEYFSNAFRVIELY